jgi:hypothetical protein
MAYVSRSRAMHAECADRARGRAIAALPGAGGALIMTRNEATVAAWTPQAMVQSCWMCGIRLGADQMVADGGSACSDVRWYCRDTRGCTQRWTARLHEVSRFGEAQ